MILKKLMFQHLNLFFQFQIKHTLHSSFYDSCFESNAMCPIHILHDNITIAS